VEARSAGAGTRVVRPGRYGGPVRAAHRPVGAVVGQERGGDRAVKKLLGTEQLSPAEKVELVASVRDEYGLAPALAAVELPKATWYYHQNDKVSYEEKYAFLRPALEEIAREHPEYGYRRTGTELREGYSEVVNHKVIRRLHQQWHLALLRSAEAPRPSGIREAILAAGRRVNLLAQLEQVEPLMVVQTDFTELPFAGGRHRAHLMPILDHASKVVLGWAVGASTNRELALAAWKQAKESLRALGLDHRGLIMHHDQDSVYTSYDWTGQLLLRDRLQLSYALDGAKDNTEVESFFSRFKSENRSLLLDAPALPALKRVVKERMEYYNRVRRHSSLGNVPPLVYLQRWLEKRAVRNGRH
jgi:putative transposase